METCSVSKLVPVLKERHGRSGWNEQVQTDLFPLTCVIGAHVPLCSHSLDFPPRQSEACAQKDWPRHCTVFCLPLGASGVFEVIAHPKTQGVPAI